MRYVFWAPPIVNLSAGVRYVHRLCHFLNVLGEEAYVTTDSTHPFWNTPYTRTITDETVMIMPESVPGNPMNAKRIVRICGNAPGALGFGDKVFADTDMVFYYEARYYEAVRAATNDPTFSRERELRLAMIDPEVFYPDKSVKKQFNCVYRGKPARLQQTWFKLQDETGFVQLTYETPPTRIGVADLLRQTQILVSYDDCTMLLPEALICGAEVRVIDQKVGNMYEYKWNKEVAGYGLDTYATDYYDTKAVQRFIRLTRERWG